jgi:hypothetical protein
MIASGKTDVIESLTQQCNPLPLMKRTVIEEAQRELNDILGREQPRLSLMPVSQSGYRAFNRSKRSPSHHAADLRIVRSFGACNPFVPQYSARSTHHNSLH